MNKLILLLLPCLYLVQARPEAQFSALAQDIKSGVDSAAASVAGLFNKCPEIKFSGPDDCAFLFDDHRCDGWQEPVSTKPGYRELGILRINDAQSVKVKKGCLLTIYQHASPDVTKRGASFEVSAKGQSDDVSKNLEGSAELESKASAVDCTCA